MAEREITLSQAVALLLDHLHPRAAAQCKGRFLRKVGEILVAAEQMPQSLCTLDAASGTGKVR